MLDGGAEFADIAGPVVIEDVLHGLGGEFAMRFAIFEGAVLQKGFNQKRDVHLAVAQRRHGQRHDMQAEIQVVAEFSLGYEFREILVRGGDQSDIGGQGFAASHTLESPLAENAENFHLGRKVDLADFIQKERAALGLLEPPDPALKRPGERSFLVAEKLARQ